MTAVLEVRRWAHPEAWVSLGLAAILAAVQVLGTFGAAQNQPDRAAPDALGVLLLLAGPATLTVRLRYPAAVAWANAAIALAYFVLGYAYGPIVLSMVIALYTAVTAGRRLAAWGAAGALYAVHLGYLAVFDEAPTLGMLLGVAAWLLVVLVASEVVRAYRERATEAAAAQREEERRRASDERLRIARDLHDVLAHHISLMNVQAGVALHLMDRQPEQARTALTAIEEASREAMSELRSVLDILRRPEEAAPRTPVPDLARLDSLRSQAAAAGLDVRVEVEGDPAPLGSAAEAAAYRVVQEAVTNVIRHASARSALVRLVYGEQTLTVQVDDDGQGATTPAQGTTRRSGGIAGMRERVLALGGEFEAGPRTGGGFRVRASLPLAATK